PARLARNGGLSVAEGVASVAARKYLLVLSQAAYLLLAFTLGRHILEDGFRRAAGLPSLAAIALVGGVALASVAELTAVALRGGSVFCRLLELASRIPKIPPRHLQQLRDGVVRTDAAAARFFGLPATS